MDVRMPELDGIEATRRLLANGGLANEGRDADDVRHGRVRLRRAARGRERVPAQGRSTGAARRRHPRGRDRRRAARAVGHAPPDRGVRPLRSDQRCAAGRSRRADAARARGAAADRARALERRDRGGAVRQRDDGEDARRACADEARPARPGAGGRPRVRGRQCAARRFSFVADECESSARPSADRHLRPT